MLFWYNIFHLPKICTFIVMKKLNMNKICLALLAGSMILSCEKKSEQITDSSTKVDSVIVPESNEPIELSTVQNCYISVVGKDSVFFSIEDNLGTLIGKMRYKNFEKDSSFGEISGTQNGDTLKLNYVFEAEGMTSEREIYFLKKDGNLLEGIGDHVTEGSTDRYANPGQLKYEGHTLKPVDCVDFDRNFPTAASR